MPTLYDILQIAPSATHQQVRAAYRQWMKQLHPDTGAQPSAETLQQIMYAYQVLSNPQKRRIYDQKLAENRPDGSPLQSLKEMVLQGFAWLTTKNDPPENQTTELQSRPKTAVRKKDLNFARKLSQAQTQAGQARFVRGADGIYRRTSPQDEILVDTRPVRRPLSNRPAPLQKPGAWKLWR